MIVRCLPRPLLLGLLSVGLSIGAGNARAALLCPGDLNNDQMVTIDEIVRSVNSALNGCGPGPGCGDGVVQSALGEQCDGADHGGQTCTSLGFSGGTLACTVTCEFNTSECTSGAALLQTGQSQCDQGSGTLDTCPGSPPGQDGAVRAGVPLGYTDNGDGTIQSNATGLIWEKLSDDGGIHDWDNVYTWDDAFGVKIAALDTPPCFAGHCDWRLPNRRELDSLVDADRTTPAIDPTFNAGCMPGCSVTACSCTQSDNYWSSTSYQDPTQPGFAWNVDFNIGSINGFDKTLPAFYVRAVRGGS